MIGGLPPVQVLKRGDKVVLENGDHIGLIPDAHWLKVVIEPVTDCPPRLESALLNTTTDSDRELLEAAAHNGSNTLAESSTPIRRPETPPTPDAVVSQNNILAFISHPTPDLPVNPENGVLSPESEPLIPESFSSPLKPQSQDVSSNVICSSNLSPRSPSMVTESTQPEPSTLRPVTPTAKIRRLPDWMLSDSGPSPKKCALDKTLPATPKRSPVEETPVRNVPPSFVIPRPALNTLDKPADGPSTSESVSCFMLSTMDTLLNTV